MDRLILKYLRGAIIIIITINIIQTIPCCNFHHYIHHHMCRQWVCDATVHLSAKRPRSLLPPSFSLSVREHCKCGGTDGSSWPSWCRLLREFSNFTRQRWTLGTEGARNDLPLIFLETFFLQPVPPVPLLGLGIRSSSPETKHCVMSLNYLLRHVHTQLNLLECLLTLIFNITNGHLNNILFIFI